MATNAPRDLTAERAAALFKQLDDGLYGLREDGESHQMQEAFGVELLMAFAKTARQEALREACRVLYARRDKLEKEWQDDETVPKGEHDEKDCDGACDLYCVQIIELGLAADELDRLASEGG